MANTIKFIRGAEASLPTLNQGEPAFTTDTKKVFIGDGAENHELAKISDVGETNTASNIGDEVEIFSEKDGVDLEFRTLKAGTGIDLYNSVPTGGWDLTTVSYDSVSKDIGSEFDYPYGIAFKPDGTKMYIVDYVVSAVYQYSLSTAWNVSTATYDSVSKDVSSENGSPRDLTFKSDGTKMYIMGTDDTIYQYSLSTGWDLNTASYDSVSKDIGSQETSPYGVAFKPDGTKMYIVGSTNNTVYQYSLSTAWNVSTASYDTVSKAVGSQDSSPRSMTFKPDGTKMYIVGSTNNTVYQYTLSTGWNVSTATYNSVSKGVSSQETTLRSMTFKPDGTKMYIVGNANDTVYQYTVGGTTTYDYVQIDLDLPNDATKFLDGTGAWNTLVESDISDLGTYLENISEDETPELGGDLGLNENNIVLDSTLTDDHSFSGIIDIVTVGESVVFGNVLYLDATDSEWKKANAAGTDTYPGLVIALESKADGNSCKVLRYGYLRDDSFDWTLGDMLLLGETAGTLTDTVPSDEGDMVQRLGYAISDDEIFFNPSIDIGEI